jgi:enterochelin esterase family protein
MMKHLHLILGIIVLLRAELPAQDVDYSRFSKTVSRLETGEPAQSLALFDSLYYQSKIPLVYHDSVAFLMRVSATSIHWMGDFNGWGYQKDFPNKGKQITGTDIWLLKARFPKDARLDYKILVDGSNWILDPENKFQQWSGVGGGSPNSELRMPEWKEDPYQVERSTNHKGKLISDVLINSKILGYQIMYSVYMPYGFSKADQLPCIYVTDGYEYLHPKLGNMTTVLDNLIEDKKITPVMAIFIDHRAPVDRSNNRRMQELAMNSKYLNFFTEELIPKIESSYPVIRDAQHRAIMGTSMGGLTATYFAFTKPDVFGMAGIQSPAFYTRPQIYALCSNPADPKMKISMTSGLINDTSLESRKMKDVLEANSCMYQYREVNEGHSWGNWKRLIDDILIDLFSQSH